MRKDEFQRPGPGMLNGSNTREREKQSLNYNIPVRVLSVQSLLGDNVRNPKGEDLGEIKDIMMNMRSGCIEYMVLKFGGFLGIGEKLFAIPFKAMKVDASKKVFILDIRKEFMENAPGFDKDHWPETNSRHWEEVNNYWRDHQRALSPAGNIII